MTRVFLAFGMQGSLVQIQSSRSAICKGNQDVRLGQRRPDFLVLAPQCPNSGHKAAVQDLPPARSGNESPSPAPKGKRIKYGVSGFPLSPPDTVT